MSGDLWPAKRLKVASLHLDRKNPRLGRETSDDAPRVLIQYLFENDKAMDVAQSIATRGFFPNEPLLAVKEEGRLVVVEGNRRLAALKALLEPGLLDGSYRTRVERLSKGMDLSTIGEVPVVLAPSRRTTDRLVAGRHAGYSVMPWQAENRASFILDKLEEGYSNEKIRDELGFTIADIGDARQTRAIAEMARSLELEDEVREKVANPRAKLFTTLARVFESSVGRKYLMVKPDPDHGLRGTTTKGEFLRGFSRLVTDVALGKVSSRSLNTSEDIGDYFRSWDPKDLPAKKQGSFVPADVIEGKSFASPDKVAIPATGRSRPVNQKVIPKNFKVKYCSGDRLVQIRDELTTLDRRTYPNAGAVLLRVFLELAIIDYLKRSGRYEQLTERLSLKGDLPPDGPPLKQLVDEIKTVAKEKIKKPDVNGVLKALAYDKAAPFNVTDLHAFVHNSREFPREGDIEQFWNRAEPLFRLMLEEPIENGD